MRKNINIKIVVVSKDVEILTTALREYAERHPKPACHAMEAESLADLIEYQAYGADKK